MGVKKQFGLIGRNISYSFSRAYFTEKFEKGGFTGYVYDNFDIADIAEFPLVLSGNPDLGGLNVTIPYKEAIIPYLDKLSKTARQIGAINTIKLTKKGGLKGYNTDFYGFKKSLRPLLHDGHQKALILGTGGASKAVAYALDQMDIPYLFVSRSANKNTLDYTQLSEYILSVYTIIINCTPVGTSPNTDAAPVIPYEFLSERHIAFDLIYNPSETLFLKKAAAQGAITRNGLDMLVFQAEKAWEIWNR